MKLRKLLDRMAEDDPLALQLRELVAHRKQKKLERKRFEELDRLHGIADGLSETAQSLAKLRFESRLTETRVADVRRLLVAVASDCDPVDRSEDMQTALHTIWCWLPRNHCRCGWPYEEPENEAAELCDRCAEKLEEEQEKKPEPVPGADEPRWCADYVGEWIGDNDGSGEPFLSMQTISQESGLMLPLSVRSLRSPTPQPDSASSDRLKLGMVLLDVSKEGYPFYYDDTSRIHIGTLHRGQNAFAFMREGERPRVTIVRCQKLPITPVLGYSEFGHRMRSFIEHSNKKTPLMGLQITSIVQRELAAHTVNPIDGPGPDSAGPLT